MDIYLDHASTTPLSEEVKNLIVENLDVFGNPSSLHRLGVVSEKKIKASRSKICDALKIKEKELIFTSGGTEANNLAILGSASKRLGRFITSKIEHPSVLNAFETLSKAGHDVIYLDVDEKGIVDISALKEALTHDTQLVSIMFVNNEIGSIQPIEKIAKIIDAYNRDNKTRVKFHVDAVQALGKIPLELDRLHIDLMSLSAHKINALKGTGALYVREGVTLKAMQFGGQQEQGLRPGTENLLGIMAFGEAVKAACINMAHHYDHVTMLRELVIKRFKDQPNIFMGCDENYSPYIINVSFEGVKGEVLLHALEMKGIYIATGSACSSKKKTVSHVLSALGYKESRMEGAIRISFSYTLSAEEVEVAADEIIKTASELRQIMNKKNR